MLEDVAGIEIQNDFFEQKIKLNLFTQNTNQKIKEDKNRVSLIYGKNGSGKSTIANAFNIIKNDVFNNENLKLVNYYGDAMKSDEIEKENIYVFNENYIEKNVKIKEKGLKSIIIIGEANYIQEQMTVVEEKKEEIKKKLSEKNEMKEQNNKKLDETIERIKKTLREENGWADRDSKIKGNKQKSNVNIEIIKKIMEVQINDNDIEEKLFKKYFEKKEELDKINAGNKKLLGKVYPITEYKENIRNLIQLMNLNLNTPNINSEIEKRIFSSNRVEEIKSYFENKDKECCPFCFQNITDEYLNELMVGIEKIFKNKEIEEYKEQLKLNKLNKIILELNEFNNEFPELVTNIKQKLENYNNEIENINNKVDEKIKSPYAVVSFEYNKLENSYNEVNSEIAELNKNIEEFNNKITNYENIKKNLVTNLIEINKKIAKIKIQEKYKKYQDINKETEKISNEISELNNQLNKIIHKHNTIKSQLKNTKIAIDIINKNLSYIFGNNQRLKIEYCDDESYELFSYGKRVSPNKISVGERNAIALCYFFSHILENKTEKNSYKNNNIIILDDPISSFDKETDMAILTYIVYKIIKYIENSRTKIIILTHDINSVYKFRNILRDYGNKNISTLELKNKAIEKLELDNRNEYTNLIKTVFEYSKGNKNEYNFYIMNMMRKLLEAFCTFNYKKGINSVLKNKNISGNIQNIDFFKKIVSKVFINMESHMENKVMLDYDNNLFESISEKERIRLAKAIILLMYKINGEHILAHLISNEDIKERNDVKKILENWENEII